MAAIKHQSDLIHLPASLIGGLQGNEANFQKIFGNLPVLILAAFLTIYVVLGVLYESYAHPFTILSTLPSAGVGAFLALIVCRTELSLVAVLGLFLLIGIVKKNAIMMIDLAIVLERNESMAPAEAIFEASRLRFRPIMMTTSAALLAALPLAIGFGSGAEFRRPLGISIIGGLIVSQLLTLYTTPVVYLYVDRVGRWLDGPPGRLGRLLPPPPGRWLVLNLIGLRLPLLESGLGGVAEQRLHRDRARPRAQRDLPVNEIVVEADVRRITAGVAVVGLRNARPIDRGQAHRAGLAAGVELAVGQLEGAQAAAGLADGRHLGMRGRVVARGHPVLAPGDDLAAADDDAAKRPAAIGPHRVLSEADRLAHEIFRVHRDCLHGPQPDRRCPQSKVDNRPPGLGAMGAFLSWPLPQSRRSWNSAGR